MPAVFEELGALDRKFEAFASSRRTEILWPASNTDTVTSNT